MSELPDAPATHRNRAPILEVLQIEFADRRRVLEIGSGTGQHAVFFAGNLPRLEWQPTDLAENLPAIRGWIARASSRNVKRPVALNVENCAEVTVACDAVFSANTAHIMNISAVRAMFDLAGRLLPEGGRFCLYGPFNFEGEFTSDSNRDFDRSLRRRDPEMGIRDVAQLDEFAEGAGLNRTALYAMPANNFIAVWTRAGDDGMAQR